MGKWQPSSTGGLREDEPLDSLGNVVDFQTLKCFSPRLSAPLLLVIIRTRSVMTPSSKAAGVCALCGGARLSELHRPRRSWSVFAFAEPLVLSSHPLGVETPAPRGQLIC